jgi:hypothetical protein
MFPALHSGVGPTAGEPGPACPGLAPCPRPEKGVPKSLLLLEDWSPPDAPDCPLLGACPQRNVWWISVRDNNLTF